MITGPAIRKDITDVMAIFNSHAVTESFHKDWKDGDVVDQLDQFDSKQDFEDWLKDNAHYLQQVENLYKQLTHINHQAEYPFENSVAAMNSDIERGKAWMADCKRLAQHKYS